MKINLRWSGKLGDQPIITDEQGEVVQCSRVLIEFRAQALPRVEVDLVEFGAVEIRDVPMILDPGEPL